MQQGSSVSLDSDANSSDCAFCQHHTIATNILKETPTFRIVADHAPLTEGHILIVPKQHYACYGAMPPELDQELLALKREVQQFFQQFYAPVVFWEHGVFRQTVFHAHLHCFPFGETKYQLSDALHDQIITSQDDIRAWCTSQGHYFYMEDPRHRLLFAPQVEHYLRIIQEVLWSGVAARDKRTGWRSPQQRMEEGRPLIEATAAKWHTFQQQGESHAD